MSASITPLRVVIVGGGVGALEALMALHDLGERRFALTLVAPNEDFALRPMSVAVPFSAGHVTRVPLASVARHFGATLHRGTVQSVDAAAQAIHCDDGSRLEYDRLILATGGRAVPAYRHALSFDDQDPTQVNGLLQDIDEGYCASVAVVVPPSGSWALPAYELALLIAREAHGSAIDAIAVHLVTPESMPLAIFGTAASAAVAALLEQAGIEFHGGCYATIERQGEILLAPGSRRLRVSRVVALPAVAGRPMPGIPRDDHGFVAVDRHGRVAGLTNVYAVGDVANFPVKQGGLAAQQADAAARHIASDAGARVQAEPFRPVLRGKLLTGAKPRYLRNEPAGGAGEGRFSDDMLWWPPAKVVGHYLAPFLERATNQQAIDQPPPQDAMEVAVELPEDRDAQPLALSPLGPLPRRPSRG